MTVTGVKLNLGSCHIRGSGVSVGIRIDNVVNNLEIRNAGPITEFQVGIFSNSTTNGTTIRNTRIRLNTRGMDILGNNNVIDANRVAQNGEHGMFLTGDGNQVVKNQIRENSGSGIDLLGTLNEIGDNAARDNAGDGICVSGRRQRRSRWQHCEGQQPRGAHVPVRDRWSPVPVIAPE